MRISTFGRRRRFGLADPTDTEEQLKKSAKRFLVRKHKEIVEEYQVQILKSQLATKFTMCNDCNAIF